MSSWVRSAVSKAVEAGGQGNLRRNLLNYADSVKLQATNAVVGGAKIFQDRMVARNMRSFRNTVKRLEEVSVSCRGIERVQLLRRWLVALKEIERLAAAFADSTNSKDLLSEDIKDLTLKPTLVYYVDPGMVDEPKNYRDVFLTSQALEGMTLSMILEAPNEEEVSLMSEIYGLCIKAGKEERAALLSSIQDLAKAFFGYEDEVLAKREELLQYVQGAISGLKVHADLIRIEEEASILKEKIEKMKASIPDANAVAVEAADEALLQIQMCSKLEELLLRKKYLIHVDSPELHANKVDKLKVLSESLANSARKAENRIWENRSQKEEALHFRVNKSNEVNQIEKELASEIIELENQKDELEEKLKKVNTLLTSARMRLHNAKEEREQFDEASTEIIVHLKTREDEMVRAISSYTVEASVVDTWIGFLESTWIIQNSQTKEEKKQVNSELERCGSHFENLVVHLLSYYKENLGSSISQIRKLVENLSSSQGLEIPAAVDNDDSKENPRKKLQDEYLDMESKFFITMSIVDTINKKFHIPKEGIFRKDTNKVTELFGAIKKIKDEFESIERPNLEIETPTQNSDTPNSQTPLKSPSQTSKAEKQKQESPPAARITISAAAAESSQIEAELENLSDYDSAEEISEWEFDAPEKDNHTRS